MVIVFHPEDSVLVQLQVSFATFGSPVSGLGDRSDFFLCSFLRIEDLLIHYFSSCYSDFQRPFHTFLQCCALVINFQVVDQLVGYIGHVVKEDVLARVRNRHVLTVARL